MTLRWIFAAVLVGLAAWISIGLTIDHIDIARSAFFGIRAPADPLLGWEHAGWGALPWVSGLAVWLGVRKTSLRTTSCWWLASDASDLPGKVTIVASVVLATAFLAGLASVSILG